MTAVPATVVRRFGRFVDWSGACWLWTGGLDSKGYGSMWGVGHPVASHRIAWQLAHGPIPPGLHVLHRCDNPACVRPQHLRLGTHADNMRDMKLKGRGRSGESAVAHCPQRHPYAGTNLYVDKAGTRRCRQCDRDKQRRYRALRMGV